MPKRRIGKAGDLTGLLIFQEAKNTVFYDVLSRKGYILTNADVKTYVVYSAMLPVCALVAFFSASFFRLRPLHGIAVFLVLYLISALLFRFLFFYKLPEAKNFRPSAGGSIISSMRSKYSKAQLTALVAMLIGLDILMPLYAFTAKLEGLTLYALYLLTAFTVLGTILTFLVLRGKE